MRPEPEIQRRENGDVAMVFPAADVRALEKVDAAIERQAQECETSAKPRTPPAPKWPEIDQAMFYGLAGDIVRVIAPHTEADQVALLTQFLAAFGNCAGRFAYYAVEGDRHYANIYPVQVGESGKGRKGTSWGRVRQALEYSPIATEWLGRVESGLSSGEGLIWAVRDPVMGREKTGKGMDAHYVEVEVDPGVSDKRLLIVESEFANVLRVMTREGNTLSRVIRDAWDRGDLHTLTKNSQAIASDAHISIVGHITTDELRRYLDRTEAANGFANRFIFICVKRSKVLPFGGSLSESDLAPLGERIEAALKFAQQAGRIDMTDETRRMWAAVYEALSDGQPGLLGSIIGRSEAQTIRLALLYALVDQSSVIRPEHLTAALALWEYAEASARYIFGGTLGDPVADEILRALKQSPDGMTRTEISNLFKRHRSSAQIGRALELLTQHGKAEFTTERSDGRSTEIWRAS